MSLEPLGGTGGMRTVHWFPSPRRRPEPWAAGLTGALLFAAFPPLEWAPAGWVALAPLVWACRRAAPGRAARLGFGAGLVFWLPSIAWLTRVTWVGWLALSAYCAGWIALFALGAAWVLARCSPDTAAGRAVAWVAVPALWVGFEFLRATVFSGFPWNPLGVSQYAWPALIQSAEFGGVYLVSFGLALGGTGLALALGRAGGGLRAARAAALDLAVPCAAALLVFAHGQAALRRDPPDARPMRISAVQVNIPQVEKWTESWTEEINGRLRRMSRAAARHDAPDLIVWPETAVPDFVRASSNSLALVQEVLALGVPLLMGSMDADLEVDPPRFFNSAFLFEPGGGEPQSYAKRHLVLFGEYVPFERRLPWLRALTPVQESFTPGREATVFRLGARRFSVLICFEDTVACLAREAVRAGARLLVNQTNDAWFDPSWASRQHRAHGVFRCVENRVPAVRVTNTGVTCFLDSCGRVLAELPRGAGRRAEPAVLTRALGLPPDTIPLTFYTRQGDWLGAGCAALAAAALAAVFASARRAARAT